MSGSGAYGRRLAETFHLDKAPAFVSHTLRKAEIAVTQIKCDVENNGLSAPIPREDAFLITVQVRDCPKHELWLDERPNRSSHLKSGVTSIYDLRRNPIALGLSPFHSLHFYVPHGTFNMIADMEGEPRVDEFRNDPGLGVDDAVLRGLAFAMLPAFERQDEVDKLFIDHATVAVAAHALRAHGIRGRARPAPAVPPVLSPGQERRAKERLAASLDGNVPMADLAKECGLPVSEFSCAFQRSAGALPHRWLLRRRIDTALDLLRHSRLSLAEVASASGFADVRHLERVLLRAAGIRPDTWRRFAN